MRRRKSKTEDRIDPRILELAGIIGRLIAREEFNKLLQSHTNLKKLDPEAANPRGSLTDFFATSPLRNSGLKMRRKKGPQRKRVRKSQRAPKA